MPKTFLTPPRRLNYAGRPRRLGVELEFAAINSQIAAEVVKETFGGQITEIGRHQYIVENTSFGRFEVELDSRYFHTPAESAPKTTGTDILDDFRTGIRDALGDFAATIIPCEIKCPPVAIDDLGEIETLLSRLRSKGARGTESGVLYAFAVQLNPEIADQDTAWILSLLKAYLLSSDWLRAVVAVDMTRKLASFATAFPDEYVNLVSSDSYSPDLANLIDDYLLHNPTRNRELDMLPLFRWLDEDRVVSKLPTVKINARPAFHYRLPDARIGETNWSVIGEWNRWCLIERLAENPELLNEMSQSYRANNERIFRRNWAVLSSEWLAYA